MRFSVRTRIVFLVLLTAVVVVVFFVVRPFAQPLAYHHFADQRPLPGIPRFGDVASNLPFALVRVWGLAFLLSARGVASFIERRERWPYLIAFAGLILTFFGSSYYHLQPDNARLVWDRLPIMLTFTAIASAVIAERIEVGLGLALCPVLVAAGLASVLVWYRSELRGAGDLRFYAAMQVWCTLVLLVLLLFPARYTRGADLAAVAGWYALAKVFELLDKPIFAIGRVVSGHTLKHLAAGAASYWILRMLRERTVAVQQSDG